MKTAAEYDRDLRAELLTRQVKAVEAAAQHFESYANSGSHSADVDQYTTGNATGLPRNGIWTQSEVSGDGTEPVTTDVDLDKVRNGSRIRYRENPWACNIIDNLVLYGVGEGHTYKYEVDDTEPGEPEEPDDTEPDDEITETDQGPAERIQAWHTELLEAWNWHERQGERMLREERDGECFLYKIREEGAAMKLRFLEPHRFTTPSESQITDLTRKLQESLEDGEEMPAMDWTFGVVTDKNDFEKVYGYVIDAKSANQTEWPTTFIPARDIQHTKRNVTSTVKRGLPTTYGVRKPLDMAWAVLMNTGKVADFQSRFGMIQIMKNITATGAAALLTAQGQAARSSTSTDDETSNLKFPVDAPGVVTTSGNVDIEFPQVGASIDALVSGTQALLRMVAAGVKMPEFLVSSDASNGNFASILVAEGPGHKMFKALQGGFTKVDVALFEEAAEDAIAAGEITQVDWDKVSIAAEPPRIQTREPEEDASVEEILTELQASSPQTVCAKFDRKAKKEHENRMIALQWEKKEAILKAEIFALSQPDTGEGDDDDESGEPNTGSDDEA